MFSLRGICATSAIFMIKSVTIWMPGPQIFQRPEEINIYMSLTSSTSTHAASTRSLGKDLWTHGPLITTYYLLIDFQDMMTSSDTSRRDTFPFGELMLIGAILVARHYFASRWRPILRYVIVVVHSMTTSSLPNLTSWPWTSACGMCKFCTSDIYTACHPRGPACSIHNSAFLAFLWTNHSV